MVALQSVIDRRDVHVTYRHLYMGGRWVDPIGGGTIDVLDPSTAIVLGSVPEGDSQDASVAVEAAADALAGWSATEPGERAELLMALAAQMTVRSEELAWLISAEVGSPIDFSRTQQV